MPPAEADGRIGRHERAAKIDLGIGHARLDVGVGGQVPERVDRPAGRSGGHGGIRRLGIVQIADVKRETWVRRGGRQVFSSSQRQVVDADHGVAAGQEGVGEMAADEASGTCQDVEG